MDLCKRRIELSVLTVAELPEPRRKARELMALQLCRSFLDLFNAYG